MLVQPVDWVPSCHRYRRVWRPLDSRFGPGDILTRVTAPVIRGLGVGIIPAATRGGQRNLFTVGAAPEVGAPWSTPRR